ncbi:MAG: DUF3352 domain-containing protein [Cyanobacteria bacterium SBC]|nr:DUF3352 domain-containing protein [Cyanobacteria bacterium SBC]
MIKLRKSPPWRVLGVAALLVFGGGISYWVLARKPSENAAVVGSRLVPQDALMAVSVSTAPDRWQQLDRYGTPDSQKLFQDRLTQLQDRLLKESGYNYRADIQPWVGDRITVALLPPSPITPDRPTEADKIQVDFATVFVLPVKNLNRARQLANGEETAPAWTERTYKGITIRERESDEMHYSMALVDRNFVVVTTDPVAIDRAIDAYKQNASIASMPGYNRAWSNLNVANPFIYAFVNVPAALESAAETSTRSIDVEALANVETQGIATAVTLENDGIRLQSLSWLDSDSQTTFDVEGNSPPTTIDRLPAETQLAIAGSNLNRIWQDYLQNAQANPLLPLDVGWLRTALQQTVGIDLDSELLSWMTGEFAFAIVPTLDEEDVMFPQALVLMVQVGDRNAAESFFRKLDRAVAEKYEFNIEEREVEGFPVVHWDTRRKGLDVSHGWVDNGVAFFSVGVPVTSRLLPQPSESLARTSLFQEVVPRQPDPSNGLFFVNLTDSQGETNLFLPRFPDDRQAIVDAIDSIGVRAGILDERSSRYDIFVKISSEK